MASEATLTVAGRVHRGWKEARVVRSLERLAGSFELTLTDRWTAGDAPTVIVPGQACSLSLAGVPVITGYVDEVRPAISATAHEIRVSGRDVAGDLVDCAPDYRPGEWRGLDLARLVEALAAPFGIPVRVLADTGAPIEVFRAEQGETAWEAIERAARLRSVLVTSDGLGGLDLISPPGARADVGLRLGENLVSAAGVYSAMERYSQYTVKAQQESSDFLSEESAAYVVGRASDAGVGRARPMTRVLEAPGDTATAQRRAEWEARVRRARSRRAVVTVQGWRQRGETGPLWAPNQLADVYVPDLGIDRDLVISEAEYSKGARGTTTRLTLMDPAAFRPEPARPPRSSAADALDAWWSS